MVPDPALRLIQSFASTSGAGPDTDRLRTREDAASWLAAAELLPGEAGLTNSEHAALLRLRASIGDVLAAHAGGHQDADAAARLTRALADGRLVLTVEPDSTVRLASAARASYSHIVAAFAVAIAESAASGQWRRLKACVTAGCGQVFYDGSPSSAGQRCPAHATALLGPVRVLGASTAPPAAAVRKLDGPFCTIESAQLTIEPNHRASRGSPRRGWSET